jgi:hypothetical protein
VDEEVVSNMLAMDYSELHIPLSIRFGFDGEQLKKYIADRYVQLGGMAFRSAGRGEAAVIAGFIDLLKNTGQAYYISVVGDDELAEFLGVPAGSGGVADVVVVAGNGIDLRSIRARWIVICAAWGRDIPSELYDQFKGYFVGGAFDDAKGVLFGFTGADLIRGAGADTGEGDRSVSGGSVEGRDRVVGRKRAGKEEEVPSAPGLPDSSGDSKS